MNPDVRRELAWIAAGLAVVILVAYAAPLFGGATFVGRDHLTHTLPGKQVIADALRDGRLPEWWSGVDLGVPFAANPNHSALYPPVWLVALLPMPWSADVVLILHVWLAGLGAAVLARRFGARGLGAAMGGASFMLTGYTTSTVVHGGPLFTLAWTPWLAWAADRLAAATTTRERVGRASGIAALFALQLLAGDPSIAILTGLLVAAVVACRAQRRLASLAAVAAAVVAAILLAAVAVLPALMLARDSTRGSGVASELATAWSLHPLRALEWIWPQVFGDANHPSEHLARVVADASGATDLSPAWALSLYIGLPVVVLAVIGWLRSGRDLRRLAWAAGGFVLLALGKYTPVYGVYRAVFLPERLVRYPEKYTGGAILLVCVMAGVGWTTLAACGLARRGASAFGAVIAAYATAVLAALVAAAPLGSALAGDSTRLEPPLDANAALQRATSNGLSALLVALVLASALYLSRREGLRRWMAALAAVVLVGHLATVIWQVLPLFDRATVERPPRAVAEAIDGRPHRLHRSMRSLVTDRETVAARALSFYDSAAPNTATRFGFAYLRGYDQARSAAFEHAWTTWVARAGDRALDLYGVDLAVVTLPAAATYQLVRNVGQRPRAFVASRWRWFATQAALMSDLFSRGGPLDTVHLLGSGTDHDEGGALRPCATESPRPEVVRMHCDSAAGGYAVLLDAFAEGWTASVDGTPVHIERADGLVRAVAVPPGRHEIVHTYRTPGLRIGAVVSALAWLALLASWLGARYFRTRSD
jgi:hypothetical protein